MYPVVGSEEGFSGVLGDGFTSSVWRARLWRWYSPCK